MKTQVQRLRELAESRDPLLAMNRILTERAMAEAINKIAISKGDKGDEGYTPIKGLDYWTDAELQAVVDYVRSLIKDGEQGPQGDPGEKGDIGETPRLGIDYWTEKDQEKILKQVLEKLPKTKELKPEDVVKLVLKEIKMPDTGSLITKGELTEFLRRGGFRGGGDTVAAGSNITITTNNDGQKVIASTGGSGFTRLTTASTIDDTNTTFVFTGIPTAVIINGATFFAGETAGGVVVWTNVTVTVTLANPVGTGGSISAI